MSIVGGSIARLTLNGRTFGVVADSDAQLFIGGYINSVDVLGNKQSYLKKMYTASHINSIIIGIDDARADVEYLKFLADLTYLFPAAAELVSGAVWQGVVQLIGERDYSTANGTAEISISGGPFTQQ